MAIKEEIATKFVDIVNDVTGLPKQQVTPEKSLAEDLKIDSLSMVEIIYASEDEFGISIPDDAAKSLRTVQEALDLIEKQLSDAN